jgi:hypothetical protein
MEIELSDGILGLCSPIHYDILKQLKLSLGKKYPIINYKGTPPRTVHKFIWTVLLKREVPDGMLIDHEDQDPLNFTIENLRVVTPSQNNHNKTSKGNKYSGYRGIHKNGNTWAAKFGRKHLGNAKTVEDAARIWDAYIIKHVDRNSRHLNFEYTDDQKDAIMKQPDRQKAEKKGGDLPKGVYHEMRKGKDYYKVMVGDKYVGVSFHREEAIKMSEDYREAELRKKMTEHYSRPILRNEKREAIIPLSGELGTGKFAIVTDSTWHDLMLSSWHLNKDNYCASSRDGKQWQLHCYLTRFWVRNQNDVLTDHIEQGFENRLDNRLSNLRLASWSLNNSNSKRKKREQELETGIRRVGGESFEVRIKRDGVEMHAYFSLGTKEENLKKARAFLENPRELTEEEKAERKLLLRNAQSERQAGVAHSKPHSRKNPEHNNLPKFVTMHEDRERTCVVVSALSGRERWQQTSTKTTTETKIQNAIKYIETGLKT